MPENDTEPVTEEARAAVERLLVPSVQEALTRVMGDVQSISKDSRNTQQNFNFRGIDAVMNAVGPALREHGVVVVPVETTHAHEQYTTRSGALMKNVTLTVRFRFYGPGGDWIEAQAVGEAADAGDKATPKAHSVAFRTVLLQALCIPTDEPDPDSSAHERAVAQRPSGDAGEATRAGSDYGGSEPPEQQAPLTPGETVVHFGKNEGTRLGEMTDKQVDWYADTWEPSFSDARDLALKQAAKEIKDLRTIPF